MCCESRNKKSRRSPHTLIWIFWRVNDIGVVFLLVLPLIYSHIVNESIDENSEILSNSQNRNGDEGSGVIRSFRFHDFEPRSLSEHTWAALPRAGTTELDTKTIDNKESGHEKPNYVSGNRKERGIHFQADGKDLAVNLEFIIPFLRVPVTRSVELTKTAFRKFADLNVNTILLGGGFVIAAALIIALVKTMTTPAFYDYGYKKAARTANFGDDIAFASSVPGDHVSLEQRLYANNINVTACAQRAICSYLQRATNSVQAGKGSPVERIIDGLSNLHVVRGYLNGTAVMDALDTGQKKDATACEHTFRKCKWTNMQNKAWQITMNYFMNNFL